MSRILYLDNQPVKLNVDEAQLQSHPAARKIKSELQRKVTPLSGGIDWPFIEEQGQLLAYECGINSEMAIYLYVAGVKVSGLSGAAHGVELLYHAMLNDIEAQQDINHLASLLEWADQLVVKEISDLRTNYEALRDLYRIERFCASLSHLLQQHAPAVTLDFSTLAMQIFEHIDALEVGYQAASRGEGIVSTTVASNSVQPPSTPASSHRHWHWPILTAVAISGVIVGRLSVFVTG